MTTHLNLMPRLRKVDVLHHSSVRILSRVVTILITWTTLPLLSNTDRVISVCGMHKNH
jgi:hypothetical protein